MGMRWLARNVDNIFLYRFNAILQAYCTGAMNYRCFIAERPNQVTSDHECDAAPALPSV